MEKYTANHPIIGDPNLYLGKDIGKLYYGDGSYEWKTSSDSYVK